MLGSFMDAEDVVQDAWLKWSQSKLETIRSDEAFLTTLVSRLCLDKLKHEQVRRKAYLGPWLPEPVESHSLSALAVTEYADDISYAFLVALERLSPLERVAFLLHDIFDLSLTEIGEIIERSESAVRQLASRARKSVAKPRSQQAPAESQQKMLSAFIEAITLGSVENLKSLLKDDALLISDGGGKRSAALRPIYGADKILRLLMGLKRKFPVAENSITLEPVNVNGDVGVLMFIEGELEQLIILETDGTKISEAYIVRNPDKLNHWFKNWLS